MKSLMSLMFFLMLVSAPSAQAWFDGPAAAGMTGSNTTWTWASVKQAVVDEFHSFFHTGDQATSASTTTASANAPNGGQPVAAGGSTNASANNRGYWTVTSTSTAHQRTPPAPTINTATSIKTAAPMVRSIQVSRVAKSGIPFKDKYLIMGHNDVPVFEFKKFKARILAAHVKKVPLLNVGEEPSLDQSPFANISIVPYPIVSIETPKALESPMMMSASALKQAVGAPVIMAAAAQNIIVPVLKPEEKVTLEKVTKLTYDLHPDESITPLPTTRIAEEDLKLLRGLILFEKKDQCHIASGLFADLVSSTREDVAESARYHLGICLHEMNLPTEALHYLTRIIDGKNVDYAREALKESLEDLQLRHEEEVVTAANAMSRIPDDTLPQVDYLKAKYFLRKGNAQKSFEAATQVPEKSPYFFKAQYVASVAEYELGHVDASIERQKEVSAKLARKGSDKDVLALFEVNLGRSAFEKGRYKESLEAYQKVPKESPMWLQALEEMGWVQIQSKDTSGAIGNMHSIQSPYFDGVFKPESYVVRSVGYLNICQYGDAFKSLSYLDYKYAPWLTKIEAYTKSHNGDQTYQSVIKLLQGKGNQDVDNVPYPALKEIAHHRDFLNAQEGINQVIDENSGYNFIRGLIDKDRKSLTIRRNATINKVAELNNKIKKARVTPGAMRNYNVWRFELSNYLDFLSVYEFKVKIMKEGLDGLNRMAPKAQERLAAQKLALRGEAGHVLKAHMLKVVKDLHQALDNNELLKYEVFAGSGENLRYQMAGGKTGGSSKNSVERKPTGMHWDFDGEFWEDEIGHYRSSLKNNCQNVVVNQKKGN